MLLLQEGLSWSVSTEMVRCWQPRQNRGRTGSQVLRRGIAERLVGGLATRRTQRTGSGSSVSEEAVWPSWNLREPGAVWSLWASSSPGGRREEGGYVDWESAVAGLQAKPLGPVERPREFLEPKGLSSDTVPPGVQKCRLECAGGSGSFSPAKSRTCGRDRPWEPNPLVHQEGVSLQLRGPINRRRGQGTVQFEGGGRDWRARAWS